MYISNMDVLFFQDHDHPINQWMSQVKDMIMSQMRRHITCMYFGGNNSTSYLDIICLGEHAWIPSIMTASATFTMSYIDFGTAADSGTLASNTRSRTFE